MQLDAVTKMTKGIKAAVTTLNPHEVRFLVGQYYAIQEYRKSSNNQVRALDQAHQPKEVLNWLAGNMDMLENQIKGALAVYSKSTIIGKWAESICGIGPVISAGLQAHIDIEKAPTVGHIWSFAGLNPVNPWVGKKEAECRLEALLGDKTFPLGREDALLLAANFSRSSDWS